MIFFFVYNIFTHCVCNRYNPLCLAYCSNRYFQNQYMGNRFIRNTPYVRTITAFINREPYVRTVTAIRPYYKTVTDVIISETIPPIVTKYCNRTVTAGNVQNLNMKNIMEKKILEEKLHAATVPKTIYFNSNHVFPENNSTVLPHGNRIETVRQTQPSAAENAVNSLRVENEMLKNKIYSDQLMRQNSFSSSRMASSDIVNPLNRPLTNIASTVSPLAGNIPVGNNLPINSAPMPNNIRPHTLSSLNRILRVNRGIPIQNSPISTVNGTTPDKKSINKLSSLIKSNRKKDLKKILEAIRDVKLTKPQTITKIELKTVPHIVTQTRDKNTFFTKTIYQTVSISDLRKLENKVDQILKEDKSKFNKLIKELSNINDESVSKTVMVNDSNKLLYDSMNKNKSLSEINKSLSEMKEYIKNQKNTTNTNDSNINTTNSNTNTNTINNTNTMNSTDSNNTNTMNSTNANDNINNNNSTDNTTNTNTDSNNNTDNIINTNSNTDNTINSNNTLNSSSSKNDDNINNSTLNSNSINNPDKKIITDQNKKKTMNLSELNKLLKNNKKLNSETKNKKTKNQLVKKNSKNENGANSIKSNKSYSVYNYEKDNIETEDIINTLRNDDKYKNEKNIVVFTKRPKENKKIDLDEILKNVIIDDREKSIIIIKGEEISIYKFAENLNKNLSEKNNKNLSEKKKKKENKNLSEKNSENSNKNLSEKNNKKKKKFFLRDKKNKRNILCEEQNHTLKLNNKEINLKILIPKSK